MAYGQNNNYIETRKRSNVSFILQTYNIAKSRSNFFPTILAQRLSSFVTKYVHTDQYGFMPGRQMRDAIWRVLILYTQFPCDFIEGVA